MLLNPITVGGGEGVNCSKTECSLPKLLNFTNFALKIFQQIPPPKKKITQSG